MLIDTHCHLDFNRFDDDRDEVVARAVQSGVERIIVPAIDLKNQASVLAISERYPGVFAALGVHPNSADGWQDGWLDQIRELAGHNKVVAIGEIGLDYYWDTAPRGIQHEAFAAQLKLAVELNLPVIIHNREASLDVIRLLADSPLNGREKSGVLHSFSASLDTAFAALEMGFYIGITGPVTFKKAEDLRHTVSKLPLDRILVETDAPFLTPQQRRGKRNEPSYVRYIADQIAELHHLNKTEIAQITSENAARLFGQHLIDHGGTDA